MSKLVPVLIENMGGAYPELKAQQALIEKVMKEEEESFLRTLETGIRLLGKTMNETKAAGKTEISGVDTFTLYDTFGFPFDLTELILRENGLTADVKGFGIRKFPGNTRIETKSQISQSQKCPYQLQNCFS